MARFVRIDIRESRQSIDRLVVVSELWLPGGVSAAVRTRLSLRMGGPLLLADAERGALSAAVAEEIRSWGTYEPESPWDQPQLPLR